MSSLLPALFESNNEVLAYVLCIDLDLENIDQVQERVELYNQTYLIMYMNRSVGIWRNFIAIVIKYWVNKIISQESSTCNRCISVHYQD